MKSLADVNGDFVAVSFERTGPNQNHAGLCIRQGAEPELLVELRWHHQLAAGPLRSPARLAVLGIDPLRLPAVVGYIRSVALNPGDRIPYGVALPDDCFDATSGAWLLGPTGRGLTCATFVIAVLKAAGFTLLDVLSWQARPEDEAWRQLIIAALRGNPSNRQQADHIEREGACSRFRPEEVAGAGLVPVSGWPVGFAEALRRAATVVAASPPPPPPPQRPQVPSP